MSLGESPGDLYLTENVNSLIGVPLKLPEKLIVWEEKSLVPPSINLWLREPGAHISMGRLAA